MLPDGTVKRLSDGREETVFPDGTVVHVERSVLGQVVWSIISLDYFNFCKGVGICVKG